MILNFTLKIDSVLTICISVYKIYKNGFFKESFSQYRCHLSPLKVQKYK